MYFPAVPLVAGALIPFLAASFRVKALLKVRFFVNVENMHFKRSAYFFLFVAVFHKNIGVLNIVDNLILTQGSWNWQIIQFDH